MTATAPAPPEGGGPPAPGPRPRRTILWTAVAASVVLVVLIAVLATRPTVDERGISSELLGRPVPALSGTTIDGQPFDIDRLRGRWVVVNFFATWCTPCRQEHPELVRFAEEHAATGDAVLVSVPYDDDPARIADFFEQYGGDWPVLAGDTAGIPLDFGVSGVPESYLVSPEGIVAWKTYGVKADELDAAIAQASGRSPS